MKVKGLIAAVLAAVMLAGTAVYAADADDIADIFKRNLPSSEELNTLLSLKTVDGVEAKDFTDAQLIHRLYRIKNDGDLKRSMFSNYSGSFESELDTETVTWHIPVLENGSIVSEYLYDDIREGLLETEHPDVKDGIGVATIYNYDKLAGIINAANIGEPTDIKSVYITFPNNALFVYVKTAKGEYIIPTLSVKPRYYDEKDNYTYKTVFDALQVYPADELVEAYKTALEDRKRYESELEKSGNNESYTYLDGNGEIAQTTPKPMATDAPKSTEKPKETVKPKVTAEPKPTVKPTTAPHKGTPRYNENGDIVGYDYSIDEIDWDKIHEDMKHGLQNTEPILTVHSADDVTLAIDGEAIEFTDAKPFIDENNRTQIPVRAVAEAFGMMVDWDAGKQLVTISKNGFEVTFTIGSYIMTIDGEPTQMDTSAVIIGDRTYVPLRYVAEAMGMTVTWE